MNDRLAVSHCRTVRNGHTTDEVQHHSVVPTVIATGKIGLIAIQGVVIGTKKEKIG